MPSLDVGFAEGLREKNSRQDISTYVSLNKSDMVADHFRTVKHAIAEIQGS